MKNILAALLSCITYMAIGQDEPYSTSAPNSHGPIGVMGDHMHAKGEVMFSYRFMNMSMSDNLIGTDEVSSETIVTTIPSMFSGPPTLRVVPVNMTMKMHMLGLMYAPSDAITLMVMGMYAQKDMDHVTYQGMMGSTELGGFTTSASGIGDVKVSALIKLLKEEKKSLHLNMGLNLPVGSITETDDILTPMNMNPTVRIPYPMQLGSGSLDLLPGLTFASGKDKVRWGSQLSGTIRLVDNGEDYKFGNQLNLTSWGSYQLSKWLSGSLRAAFVSTGEIRGIDDEISLPVQTAHPSFQGGKRIDVGIGFNAIGQSGFVKNQRLAVEYAIPAYQNLNGPQMKTTSILTIGWQYAI